MTDILVRPATGPLRGHVPVPSDKSIGHRAILFAALAHGRSRIRGASFGQDNLSTADALRALGVQIAHTSEGVIEVDGVGLSGLRPADRPLDCGNSGTTMRLLAGVLSAQPFSTVLVGDESLSRRPMMRIAVPLRERGASIEGAAHASKAGEITAPLRIGPARGKRGLGALTWDSPISSAQVKSAVILSGLYSAAMTRFREPTLSRDHTERMLRAMGVPIQTGESEVSLDPVGWDQVLRPLDVEVPGDLSAAAFLLVAALIVPGSQVTASGVGVNPTRTGLLAIARAMGGALSVEVGADRAGEPVGELHASSAPLRATTIGKDLVSRAIDEIPIVCALAARASGTTVIADAQELRVKESDRIATMAGVLRAFGVGCVERPDGLVIEGADRPLKAADVESKGDHRIAMTACVLGLVASGVTRVRDVGCIATSFPTFVETFRRLGADLCLVESGAESASIKSNIE